MKQILLFSILIAFGSMVSAQVVYPRSKNEVQKHVPENYMHLEAPGSGSHVPYRGGFTTLLGKAGNLLTIIAGESNMIDYNEDLNTLVFIHRNDNSSNGGDIGNYRYDVSTDGGKTWVIDGAEVLNPSANTTTLNGRFPQAVIHNPAGNTDPNNAHLIYSGTYHNNDYWTGFMTGVEKLDQTGTTETITDMTGEVFGGNPSIGGSLVHGKPGTFWIVSKHTEQTFSSSKDSVTGFIIGEGTFNGTNVIWTYDTIGVDVNFARDAGGHVYQPVIAFDPTGRYGWIACGADLNGNANPGGVYSPVFWSSTDSGASWGPAQLLNAGDYSDVSDYYPDTLLFDDGAGGVDTVGSAPYIMFAGSDLIVDANGNPHWLVVIGASAWDSGGPFFYYLQLGFNIYDFHHDGTSWNAILIDTLNNFSGPMIGALTEQNRPNLSRTTDGNKIFYCWLDTDVDISADNGFPDCKVKMYDIVSKTFTATVNTTFNSDFENQAFYASVSPQAITVAPGQYIIPTVITEWGVNELSPTQFHYYESQVGNVVAAYNYIYKGFAGKVFFEDVSLFSPETWAWDFDDAGATSSAPQPSHQYTTDGTYNVCLTVTNSFATDEICQDIVVTKVGIENIALSEFIDIRPNPSNGQFTIYLDGLNANDAEIILYNLVGAEITAPMSMAGSDAIQVDLSDQANGVYFVNFKLDGKTATKMIVIGTK